MEVLTRSQIVSNELKRHELPHGLTISDILMMANWDPALKPWTVVTIDGHEVPQEIWDRVRPKEGRQVLIALRPAGGGGGGGSGKQIIGAVVMIAVAIVAAYFLGPAVAGFLTGATEGLAFTAVSAITAAAVTVGAGLLMGQFIKPPGLARAMTNNLDQNNAPESSRMYGVQGAQNTMRPYSVVPRIYGRHRFTPPLAAEPYVVGAGPTQTIFLVMDFGYGIVNVEDIRVGETPINQFANVQYRIHPNFKAGDSLTIYQNDNATLQTGITLVENVGHSRVVPQAGRLLAVEFQFPQGLVTFDDRGNPSQRDEVIAMSIANSAGVAYPISSFPRWITYSSEQGVSQGGQVFIGDYPVQAVLNYSTTPSLTMLITGTPPSVGNTLVWRGHNTQITFVRKPPVDVPGNLPFSPDLTEVGVASLPPGLPWEGYAAPEVIYNPGGSAQVYFNRDTGVTGPIQGWFESNYHVRFRGATRSPRVLTAFFTMPNDDDWKVNVTRGTPVSNSPLVSNTMIWGSLRSIRLTQPIKPRTPRTILEMRITGNEQISGQVENINALCTSVLFDPRRGVSLPTRNPALIYRDILTGTANPRPVPTSRILEDDIIAWANECDSKTILTNGDTFATCDMVVDFRSTIGELTQTVCSAGRAMPTIKDGKYSVIREREPRVPVQVFTNRNARGFESRRSWADQPHAVKVRYLSEVSWNREEVFVYNDGYTAQNATRIESLDLIGIVRPSQAWRQGRYFLAVAKLRRESLTLTADIENLVCQRGDLVRVAHDQLLSNGVARVREITGDVLHLDAFLDYLTPGGRPAVQARTSEGVVKAPELAVTVIAPDQIQVEPTLAAELQPGDIVAVGEMATVMSDWIVDKIQPGEEFSATLSLIEAAPGVNDADNGPIPPYVPANGTGILPDASPVQNLLLSTTLFSYNTAGIPFHLNRLSWDMPANFFASEYIVERVIIPNSLSAFSDQYVRTVIGRVTEASYLDTLSAQILPRDGAVVRYFVTPVSPLGRRGGTAQIETTQGPDIEGPPAIEFSSNVLNETTLLFWVKPDVPDLAYYQIRYTANPSQTVWSEMTIIADRISANTTSHMVVTRAGVYGIRAVDTSGNWGPETWTRITIDNLHPIEPVAVTQVPSWLGGNFVNTELAQDGIQLTKKPDGTYESEGWYYPTSDVELNGIWRTRIIGFIDAYAEGLAEPEGLWDAQIMLSISRDLPKLNDPWFSPLNHAVPLAGKPTNYSPLNLTYHTLSELRVGRWAIRLRSFDGRVTPVVRSAKVEWLFDPRSEGGSDVPVINGQLTVPYRFQFAAPPSLTLILNDGALTDYIVKSEDLRDRFTIQIRDASGNLVTGTRHLDWNALGYGMNSGIPAVTTPLMLP